MNFPRDFHTANQRKDQQSAIQSEINSIMKNKMWDVMDQSKGKHPITTKCILKVKQNIHGDINKFKA